MLRPESHLATAMKLYPSTSKMVTDFCADKGKGLPDWPEWCLMPMAGWYAIVSQDNYEQLLPGQRLPLHLISDVGRLAALGAWRYSKGIYRLDTDIQAALSDTLIVGDIPCEVLYRMPEWCLYIETPGYKWLGNALHGFWCHLECDANTHRHELRLLLDTDDNLIPIPIHIGPWTVTEAVDRMMSESNKQMQQNKVELDAPMPMDATQLLAASINPLISMLLYICSDAPDIDNEREPGTSPSRPKPSKTKRGLRLFPADKSHIWTVGKTLGEQLRQSIAGLDDDAKRNIKPHLRRGHWHLYWTGPRSGERKCIYKWIMPMIIAG